MKIINPYKRLKIPREELLYILPEARQKLFMHMIEEYKNRYPTFKMIFAYYNTDSKYPIDYIVLFKVKREDRTMILFDMPFLYTDRAIPGYRYCIKNNLLDDFFQEAVDSMTTISESKFAEYLNIMCNLSIDKDSELYWKNPKNISILVNGLKDLALRYTRRN